MRGPTTDGAANLTLHSSQTTFLRPPHTSVPRLTAAGGPSSVGGAYATRRRDTHTIKSDRSNESAFGHTDSWVRWTRELHTCTYPFAMHLLRQKQYSSPAPHPPVVSSATLLPSRSCLLKREVRSHQPVPPLRRRNGTSMPKKHTRTTCAHAYFLSTI